MFKRPQLFTRLFVVLGFCLSVSPTVFAAGGQVLTEEEAWAECSVYSIGMWGSAAGHCFSGLPTSPTVYGGPQEGSAWAVWQFPVGSECPDGRDSNGCIVPVSSCSSESVPAGDMGVSTKGIYNYQGCAYSCDIDMSLMDGATSYSNIWARSECESLQADYITADPADYPGYVEPDGCYTDASGKQICKAPDPGCYTVDGKQQCPENNEICGIQNGAWSCVNPETEGCGLFNGFKICYTIDGTMVPSDSPDHPDNGGNLDGDETNDMYDSRDPTTEGGDPNNQVTDGKGNATEGTAIKSLNELKAIKEAIGKIPGGGGSSANVTVDNQIDLQPLMDEVSGLKEDVSAGQMSTIENSVVNPLAPGQTADTELSNFESTISGESDAVGVDMVDSVGNTVGNLIPQGTCQDLGFTFKGHVFGLDCAKTQKIRDLLSWAFYIMTVWYIFETITTPTVRRT